MSRGIVPVLGLVALALSASAPDGLAQPTLDLRLGAGLDALAPVGASAERRVVFDGSFRPQLRFASQHGRIGYGVDGGRYNAPGGWSYLQHGLEASYRIDLGAAEKARVFTGATASWRRNGGAWSEADYDAWGAFANVEWQPRAGTTLRTGYRLADRSFAQLAELDQLEQDVFASAHVSLPSRTTLIVESHLGWKSYAGTAVEVAPLMPPAAPSAAPPAGAGRGPGSKTRRAALPSLAVVPGSGEGSDAQQWNVLAHVAQGLAERTGAWGRGFVRRTGGRVPPAIVATPVGLFDDGVYDDPFASDVTAFSAGAKHILGGGTALRISGAWQRKDFTAIPALDADGSTLPGTPLRQDRVRQFGAGVALPAADVHRISILLEIHYVFTRSRSNDVFHDYQDHAIGLTMSIHR